MSRVLSTEQAKSAIQQMQAIINGGFTDQISQLDSQGRTLYLVRAVSGGEPGLRDRLELGRQQPVLAHFGGVSDG